MVDSEEETMEELAARAGGRPVLQRIADATRPRTREAFIACLYRAMDEVIDELERRADELIGSSEDRLSSDVAACLRARYFRATREGKERGHCDIVIEAEGLTGKYLWLCEAKIHGEYEYLWEGMRQLLTRYATGRHPDVGLLIYITNRATAPVIAEWRRRVKTEGHLDVVDVTDDEPGSAACTAKPRPD